MNKTIVLIEDEEILLELLRAKFKTAGLSVYTARDGNEGLDLVRKVKPDLVLLDMLLPGFNGLQVLEKMKEEGLLPALPVLIISNSGQPVELERALDLGARDYLIKVNLDPQEILTRVMTLLGAASLPDAPISGPRAGIKVLIVEDDMMLAGLLERGLTGAGYEVYHSIDAEQAWRVLAHIEPDIILLDVVLPGTEGFTFLEELRRDHTYVSTPVLIISNLGQREEIERGLRLGAVDYIVKANVSPAEIVEKVGILIKNKSLNS